MIEDRITREGVLNDIRINEAPVLAEDLVRDKVYLFVHFGEMVLKRIKIDKPTTYIFHPVDSSSYLILNSQLNNLLKLPNGRLSFHRPSEAVSYRRSV